MKTARFLSYLLLALTIATSYSCSSTGAGEEPEPVQPTPPSPPVTLPEENVARTVLVYMAANNNLAANALDDIGEMKQAAADIGNNGRLIVYLDHRNRKPQLIEILSDGSENLLMEYDRSVSSVTVSRMSQVIADARRLSPSDSYSLILWSHGTGWLSDDHSIDESSRSGIAPLAFGQEFNRANMKLSSLKTVLTTDDGLVWDFIYFDCCHMATVEVAYELRTLTPVIAGSPTELGIDGMPYDENIRHFFAETPDIEQAATNTYKSYLTATDGCSMTVIRTAGLDALARACRDIHSSGAVLPDGYRRIRYFRTVIMDSGLYDMFHYYTALSSGNQTLTDGFLRAFNDVVSLNLNTPTVYGLSSSDFHGLPCNIVESATDIDLYHYDQTEWYRDVLLN